MKLLIPTTVIVVAVGLMTTHVSGEAHLRTISATVKADRALRIWAAGDSYAAGEGLRGVQVGEEQCQRALGLDAGSHNPPSKAWPVMVKDVFENGNVTQFDTGRSDRWTVDTFWFTACTGATSQSIDGGGVNAVTNRGVSQLAEIEAAGDSTMFDVVTLSFGGNDIGFGDVIRNCIGLDWDLLEADAVLWYGTVGVAPTISSGVGAGCSTDEQTLKKRITTDLVDNGRLETLYDTVAKHTTPGGMIVVTGYPQLFSSPELWSAKEKLINRCNRVSEGDVRALRGATGALNQTLGEAVNQARLRHPDKTWVFVDVSSAFETGTVRANLCGNVDAINGFAWNATRNGQGDGTAASGFARSYHPNQVGHAIYAAAVIKAILVSGWTPERVAAIRPAPQVGPNGDTLRMNHPTLGAVTITVTGGTAGERFGKVTPSVRVTQDSTGRTVYEWDAPQDEFERFALVGTAAPAGVPSPVDGRGHVFFEWNPGRFDGVSVLVPTDDGFDAIGTLTADFYDGFYYAYVTDVDSDGLYEIEQNFQICEPDCAGGIYYAHTWRWDGTTYSGPSEPPAGTMATCVASGRVFIGMGGPDPEVALLQSRLAELGFDPGEIDGYFGDTTWAAAVQSQLPYADGTSGGNGAFADEQTILEPVFERLGISC